MRKFAIAFFLALGACATGPTEKDLAEDLKQFEFIRGCGEADGASRSIIEYDCRYLDCRLKTCYIKSCGDLEIEYMELSETECSAYMGELK